MDFRPEGPWFKTLYQQIFFLLFTNFLAEGGGRSTHIVTIKQITLVSTQQNEPKLVQLLIIKHVFYIFSVDIDLPALPSEKEENEERENGNFECELCQTIIVELNKLIKENRSEVRFFFALQYSSFWWLISISSCPVTSKEHQIN